MDTKLKLTAITLAMTCLLSSANDGKKAVAPAKEFKPSDVKFFSESERQEWLAEMKASLPIAHRQRGPFGLLQDPSKPVLVKKKTVERSDAFLNAIGAIKVTAVLPADDKFVIGSREFVEGEVIPIIRGQKQFNVQIVSVSIDSILFKNVNSGEYVKRNMNTLPKGMSPNSKISSVDGVTPVGRHETAPLNLDQ